MESTFYKIMRKTGRKQVSCKCQLCKSQCVKSICLGTPEDIEKIIDAGYGDRIRPMGWGAGLLMNVTDHIIPMFQADDNHGTCVFFKDGLCQLHEKGLKPTEGKLSHHTTTVENLVAKKSLSWNVAKEWEDPANYETIVRIKLKLENA